MKRFALLMVSLLALAAPAFADINPLVGDISMYNDDQGTNCNITANGGGSFLTPFMVQKFSAGGGCTGIRFKITVPAGMNIVGFSTPFVPVGNVTGDLSIAYGVCAQTTTVIGNLQVLSVTASPACSYISVEKSDIIAYPLATDCSFGEYEIKAGQAIVNPDGTCQCSVATQPSTWGKVKALYR